MLYFFISISIFLRRLYLVTPTFIIEPLFNRNVGQNNVRKRQNYSRSKNFFKKFFAEYLLLKTTQNKQKYCMEILDDFFAENVDAMRF